MPKIRRVSVFPQEDESDASGYSGSDHDSDHDNGSEEEKKFAVEKIMDMRFLGDDTEYRVRWEGYTAADDTWEPEANLQGIIHLISDYHRVSKK